MKRELTRRMWRQVIAGAVVLAGVSIGSLHAQITEVGEIARDFTVTHRATGTPRTLYGDYSGQVIVLDFFAYWCGPCKIASSGLKTDIEDYYHARGGNPHGVPVHVLPVNIQSGAVEETDDFLVETGTNLDDVVNDFVREAYNQFKTGGIPMLAVVTGVDGSTSHAQWQVLYRASGWGGGTAAYLRSIIDTVEAADPNAPPNIIRDPEGVSTMEGVGFELSVLSAGPGPFDYQWHKDGVPLAGASGASLAVPSPTLDDSGSYLVKVSNANGTDTSATAVVRVLEPGVTGSFVATNVPLAIPDGSTVGVSSSLPVTGVSRVLLVRFNMTIRHTYIGDLLVTLTSPAGTSYTVHNRAGGSADDIVITGMEIDAFLGEDGSGTWQLFVRDSIDQDAGTIESWSLEFVYYDALMDAYQVWIDGHGQLAGDKCARFSDPDRDGIANIFEFLLAGHAADRPGQWLQVTPAEGAGLGYHEFVLARRAGTQADWCRVEISQTAQPGSWQEAQTSGTDVIVDSPTPEQTRVRISKQVPQSYLRLATPVSP